MYLTKLIKKKVGPADGANGKWNRISVSKFHDDKRIAKVICRPFRLMHVSLRFFPFDNWHSFCRTTAHWVLFCFFQKTFLWSFESRFTRTNMNKSTSNRPYASCFSPQRSTAGLRPCWHRHMGSLCRRRRGPRQKTRPCCSSSLRKVSLQRSRMQMSQRRTFAIPPSKRCVQQKPLRQFHHSTACTTQMRIKNTVWS